MQLARSRLLLTGAFLLAGGAAWGQDERHGQPQRAGEQPGSPAALTKIGQPAPDFTLLDCSGKKHALAELKDKVVVLEWVNKECPWSLKAVPVMKAMRKKYADKGIVWLGIDSTWLRKAEDDAKYIKDKELDFAILMDSDGKVGRAYGAKTTPHIFVINKGTLVYMGGLHNDQYERMKPSESRNYLDEALTAVLAGKDVPMAETTPWGCPVKYERSGHKTDSPSQPAAEQPRETGK